MYKNRLKQQLADGEVPLGVYVGSESPSYAEVLGQTGLDFVIIETEHGPLSPRAYEPLANLCRIFHTYDVTPLVRVAPGDRIDIGNALDAGAMGIVLPHVGSVADAEGLVKACMFPPKGERGAGPLVPANRYVGRPYEAYVENGNAEVMPIPFIEEKEGIEDFESICDVNGIAAVRVGLLDLALSYGTSDQNHPLVQRARTKAFDICRQKGIPVDVGGNPEVVQQAIESGLRVMITMGVDFYFLHDACKERIQQLRSVIGRARTS